MAVPVTTPGSLTAAGGQVVGQRRVRVGTGADDDVEVLAVGNQIGRASARGGKRNARVAGQNDKINVTTPGVRVSVQEAAEGRRAGAG